MTSRVAPFSVYDEAIRHFQLSKEEITYALNKNMVNAKTETHPVFDPGCVAKNPMHRVFIKKVLKPVSQRKMEIRV